MKVIGKFLLNIILFIWQILQNLVGLILLIGHKGSKVYETNNGDKVKVYFTKAMCGSGISLGMFIFLDPLYLEYQNQGKITEKYMKDTVSHEHGHQYQSKYWGPLYLFVPGLVSFIRNIYDRITNQSSEWYYGGFPEKQADKYGKVERGF